jgi:hypothetical protein
MGIQTLLTDSRFFLYSCVCHCSSSAHKQCPCSYALTHKLPSSFSQLCYSCWSCSSTTHHPSTHIRCYYPTSATNFHNPFLASSSSSSSSSPLSPPHTTKNRIPREKINSTLLSVQFQKNTKPKTAPPKKKPGDSRKHTTKLQSTTAIVEEFEAAAGGCSRQKRC